MIIKLKSKDIKADMTEEKGLKRLIKLPNYSELDVEGSLPNGVVVVYDEKEHVPSAELIGPNIGCGVSLAKLCGPVDDIKYLTYRVAGEVMSSNELENVGDELIFYEAQGCGVLGLETGDVVVLVHSGKNKTGARAFKIKLKDRDFLETYEKTNKIGRENRKRVLEIIGEYGETRLTPLLDLVDNSIEIRDGEVIYRKEGFKVENGEIGIIQPALDEEALVVKAKKDIKKYVDSLNSGIGRRLSREQVRGDGEIDIEWSRVRKKVYIPHYIYNDCLRHKAPSCFKRLEDVLPELEKSVSVEGRLRPLAAYLI